jgi:hypothetical protein
MTESLTLDMSVDVELDHGHGVRPKAIIHCPGCGKDLMVPDLWTDSAWDYMTNAGHTHEKYGGSPSQHREMQIRACWENHRNSGNCQPELGT